MTSFSGSYETDIGDSLKQVKSQGLEQARVQKKLQENLGSSLFRIVYKKKLWHTDVGMHAPQKHRVRQAMEEG